MPVPAYFGPKLAGPLYAGIAEQDRAKRVIDTLEYWWGPIWTNIDWFLMHRLEAYGYQDHAQRLRRTIIELCKNEGFHEYFDPLTGRGLARTSSPGPRPCSWTCSWKTGSKIRAFSAFQHAASRLVSISAGQLVVFAEISCAICGGRYRSESL